MDFVVGLPKTMKGHNAIWVIIDRLTKSAHFIPIKTTLSLKQLANLYVQEIVRLHAVPKSIVFDKDARFTSKFWRSVQRAMGLKEPSKLSRICYVPVYFTSVEHGINTCR